MDIKPIIQYKYMTVQCTVYIVCNTAAIKPESIEVNNKKMNK